ncbi:Sel1-repeat containing protein [Gracilaria domingensis]|nr:Sel1-repeat containing protein [Gracilaria domingensis]
MDDGRVVKQELFRDAIEKGECLPFEASQIEHLKPYEVERGERHYGYDAYRELLGEFISELPVLSSFVIEMREFDVNMLEWLTILLHLGTTALKLENDISDAFDSSTEAAVPLSRSNEAVSLLCSQLGVKKHLHHVQNVTSLYASAGLLSGIPILKSVISITSGGNRLVTKVGELVDVWVSLACGEQIRFLVDNLNDEWEKICFGVEHEQKATTQRCE